MGKDGAVFTSSREDKGDACWGERRTPCEEDDGIRAYIYDGTSFTNTAHIDDDPGLANGVAVGRDGTVFLANGVDGLRAYEYDGVSFVNTAHIDSVGGWPIAIGSDGTVFLGGEGLVAYTYSIATAVDDDLASVPLQYELFQNYPNPFNPITHIAFSIPKAEFVTPKIYNILGQEVATLLADRLQSGNHNYRWNPGSLASGVYIYSLQVGDVVENRKMILLP